MSQTAPSGLGASADTTPCGATQAGVTAADRGSASIWVLACCALLLVVSGVVTVRGEAVLARHRAESSADLAALAAAGEIAVSNQICPAATRIAARNGARLQSCRPDIAADGRSGTVVISVVFDVQLPLVGRRSVVASARAGREPG